MELLRSWMFVPGHRQRMIDKALASEAHALFLDIEDGVPPAEKDLARQTIAGALETIASDPPPGRHPQRFVRINAIGHERMHADLAAIVRPGLDGLCLPKVEHAEQIRAMDGYLEELEPAAGLPKGSVRYLAAIESALGLLNAPAIAAASPRMVGLMFGAEDYGKDLGLPTLRVGEASELLYARSAVVVAAASAHIGSVDGVWPDIRDPEGLRKDTVQARRLGFTGKSMIHPGQIETVNSVFRPDEGEIAYAREVIAAFDEAQARGDGAIALGGQLIDLPIVDRARLVLETVEAPGTGRGR
ncbi:MAG: CoA ester lyase [Chloroflexi bacterium]|nr:CoA ester lyase [Chloroflexota bacterium]